MGQLFLFECNDPHSFSHVTGSAELPIKLQLGVKEEENSAIELTCQVNIRVKAQKSIFELIV